MTLNLSENAWRIYHTHPHVSCWLLSNKRFPHAWNLSALSGLSGFLGLYLLVQVPIFVCFVAI